LILISFFCGQATG